MFFQDSVVWGGEKYFSAAGLDTTSLSVDCFANSLFKQAHKNIMRTCYSELCHLWPGHKTSVVKCVAHL